jgi:hypothetical protein
MRQSAPLRNSASMRCASFSSIERNTVKWYSLPVNGGGNNLMYAAPTPVASSPRQLVVHEGSMHTLGTPT